MIDPQERWAQYGEKPEYLGLLTFADNITGYWEPDRVHKQFLVLLEALYKVQPQQVEADYIKAGAFLSGRRSKRSLVVLFTDIIGGRQADSLVRGFGRLLSDF